MSDFISAHSFCFGQTDMWEAYGIKIMDNGIADDILLPPLRERKISIPQRSGAYDYGAKYYGERVLRLNCVTLRAAGLNEARAFLREVSYALSKKSEIRLWNEPDKYYIGRIYESPAITQIRGTAAEFDLSFVCEPFAYGATKTLPFDGLRWKPEYPGTAHTPTLITIRNTGSTTIQNIRITQLDRKE